MSFGDSVGGQRDAFDDYQQYCNGACPKMQCMENRPPPKRRNNQYLQDEGSRSEQYYLRSFVRFRNNKEQKCVATSGSGIQ